MPVPQAKDVMLPFSDLVDSHGEDPVRPEVPLISYSRRILEKAGHFEVKLHLAAQVVPVIRLSLLLLL